MYYKKRLAEIVSGFSSHDEESCGEVNSMEEMVVDFDYFYCKCRKLIKSHEVLGGSLVWNKLKLKMIFDIQGYGETMTFKTTYQYERILEAFFKDINMACPASGTWNILTVTLAEV